MTRKPAQVCLRDPAVVFSLQKGRRICNQKTGGGWEGGVSALVSSLEL